MFDNYIEKHGPRLYSLCLKLCKDRWEAQDLYQDTWLKAYRAIGRFDEKRDFEHWLTKICINTYRDMLRHKKLISLFSPKDDSEERDYIENLPSPETEDYSDVRQAVNELPEKYRLAVILYYFCDLSTEQSSDALGIPAGTVKSRLNKARELLKGRLKDYE